MNGHFELRGPYYLELAYEAKDGTDDDQVRTAYIDGIATEVDAWRACGRLRTDSIAAVSDEGDAIAIAPAQVLQLLIGRTNEAAFPVAAE